VKSIILWKISKFQEQRKEKATPETPKQAIRQN